MRKNLPQDIWKYVDQRGEVDCWFYTGGTFSGRYGRFCFDGKPRLAHRFVYEMTYGNIDGGLFVMHKCNNKLCCNPGHLVLGTNSENQRHASASGAFKLGGIGIRGVGFDTKRQYWTARGYRNSKLINLYTGPSKEKAVAARKKWEETYLIDFKESKNEDV